MPDDIVFDRAGSKASCPEDQRRIAQNMTEARMIMQRIEDCQFRQEEHSGGAKESTTLQATWRDTIVKKIRLNGKLVADHGDVRRCVHH